MKMYILVKRSIPLGFAVNSVGHASLACYLKFKNDFDTRYWVKHSFAKVTCEVSDEEFEAAKEVMDHVVITESALDGEELSIAFKPREEWPEQFENYELFGRSKGVR